MSTKKARKLVKKVAAVVAAGVMATTGTGDAAVPMDAPIQPAALVSYKPFQMPIFHDDETGVLVLHWSRQIGKSYVLAGWAVKRLLNRPGRLVTVLSNSRDNGREFVEKVKEICRIAGAAWDEEDLSPSEFFEDMQFEVRIKVEGKTGRVKVLAANPRTARGFSGDLILDEFAFHENSAAIWDAAEPIISSNPDYLCRIASTGNGKFNMFYRMVAGATSSATQRNPAGLCESSAGFIVSRVSRSGAFQLGQKIYDPKTRQPITPEDARRVSLDKQSYDQNYELSFNDENLALLTHELISACEYRDEDTGVEVFVCEDEWSEAALTFFRTLAGPLCFGQDVGRKRDLSVIAVGERVGGVIFVRGLLRMEGKPFPWQREQLARIARLANFGRGLIDSTGLGVGLVDFAQEMFGLFKISGVNFAQREVRDPVQAAMAEGKADRNSKADTALVTELMALELRQTFEDKAIRIPREQQLRDALRKPQKITTATGVRIAAEADEAGHADEFWAIALLRRALTVQTGPASYSSIATSRSSSRRDSRAPRRRSKLGGML